jgi:hypothetical protein
LTNDQIAERLGISRDGAKYHVSQILSKLQVVNRLEAARWFGRVKASRGQPAILGLFSVLFKRVAAPAGRVVALTAAAVTLAVVIALVAGVLLVTRGDNSSSSGDVGLDEVIETLLRAEAGELATEFGDLATSERDEWVVDGQGIQREPQERTLGPAEWRRRLAGAERSLYAVIEPRGIDASAPAVATIILAVDTGAIALEAWAFDYVDGSLTAIEIRTGSPPSTWPVARNAFINLSRLTPSLETDYDRFLVLPPPERRPQPPAQHDLSVRTGQPPVDGLIEALQRGDPGALLAAIETPEALRVLGCEGVTATLDAAATQAWATDLSISGLSYVAEVPAGHSAAASHLLMAYDQKGPYRWEPLGLLERDGRIAGVLERDCGDRWLAQMPAAYVVAPQGSSFNPSLRSSVPMIDALLDAIRDGDEQAVRRLVDWQLVACAAPGQIGSLPCAPNVALGTRQEVIPWNACEGAYVGANELIEALSGWALYAVADPMTAVIVAPDRLNDSASFRRSARLSLGEDGLDVIEEGCFVRAPGEHLMETRYLLEPLSP